MIVALVAFVIALGGTAIAASRYIITSTSQIQPDVLRELRGRAASTAAVPKGPKAIIDRIRSTSPVTTTETPTSVALVGAAWTQTAQQVNGLVGAVTASVPAGETCEAEVEYRVDGDYLASATIQGHEGAGPINYPILWEPPEGARRTGAEWLFEPSAATGHSLEVRVYDYGCSPGTHVKIESIAVDVLGFR
jgi:hypothetical protein